MVKKGGGTKRKIPIEKIAKKESLAITCTKRCGGLFSKASQLCLLSGAQIAILATPPSSNSNVSFYSFGHSSVDAVVSAFLSGKRPVPSENKHMRDDIAICLTRKDLGLGFWWEDDTLSSSQNPQELSDALDSMSKLLKDAKELSSYVKNNEMKRSNLVSHHGTHDPDQTLDLQPTSAISCIPDDCLKNTEIIVLDDDLPTDFNDNTEEHDQILAICESFCNNPLPADNFEWVKEMDLDQLIDFETIDSSFFDDWDSNNTHQELQETSVSNLMNSEAVDDVSMETTVPNLCSDSEYGALDEENLRFSGFFNQIASSAL